jgi:hypothetical protein
MTVIPDTQEVKIGRSLLEGSPVDPISICKLGMVVQAYHPSYAGGVDRRIEVKKVGPYLKNKLKHKRLKW